MNKTITLSLDDKTQTMLLLLASCAEEKFDKAKVVQEEEIACLAAAQYVKDIITKINKKDEQMEPQS